MGDGPRNPPTEQPSTRPSLLDRAKAGAEADGDSGLSATDVCTATRQVVIEGVVGAANAGDPIRVLPSSPPQAVGPSGLIGYLSGASSKQIEDCIRAGFRFEGTIVEVTARGVRASVEGFAP